MQQVWTAIGACTSNVADGRYADCAAEHTSADYVFFLGNDACLPRPDVLARLVAAAEEHSDAAYVRPGRYDHAAPLGGAPPQGRRSGAAWSHRHHDRGLVLIRRSVFDQVRGWEGNFFLGDAQQLIAAVAGGRF